MPFSKMTSVFTMRPDEVRFCDNAKTTSLELLLTNRTTFFLQISAFLGFARLLAFARRSFKALEIDAFFFF
jgi:hypothetical protein